MKLRNTILILIFTMILSGCSQSNNYENEENNSDISTNGVVSEESTTRDKETLENNENSQNNLIKHIEEKAKLGENIYCENIKLGDNISDVEEIYGQWTESNYVSEAKGIYYNYEKYKFAFGCNKGDQIFEIRSYDENLKTINLEDIENYFGTPDYESKTTEGEKVVGYKVSEDYKLKFVFNEHSLDHYSVFYPEITANYMADDPGREW